jgi:hypothetical protein
VSRTRFGVFEFDVVDDKAQAFVVEEGRVVVRAKRLSA